jgi:hypothetical protein
MTRLLAILLFVVGCIVIVRTLTRAELDVWHLVVGAAFVCVASMIQDDVNARKKP